MEGGVAGAVGACEQYENEEKDQFMNGKKCNRRSEHMQCLDE